MAEQAGEFPRLETKRLLLREINLADSEAIFQNYAGSQVTEYFMEPLAQPAQAMDIIEECA